MKQKFIVVEVDGIIRTPIAKNNKPDKYSDPKVFDTFIDAEKWIVKHTYKGMSFHYDISAIDEK